MHMVMEEAWKGHHEMVEGEGENEMDFNFILDLDQERQ